MAIHPHLAVYACFPQTNQVWDNFHSWQFAFTWKVCHVFHFYDYTMMLFGDVSSSIDFHSQVSNILRKNIVMLLWPVMENVGFLGGGCERNWYQA